MSVYDYSLIIYGIILLGLLIVNFLYFFQIFRNRLPGDASLVAVVIYLALIVFTLFIGGLFMGIS